MSIGPKVVDHGQSFSYHVAVVFKEALMLLNQKDGGSENALYSCLQKVYRTINYWQYDHTVLPRETLDGNEDGLTHHYADPVYKTLDGILEESLRGTGLQHTRKTFCQAFKITAETLIHAQQVEKEVANFSKRMKDLGRMVEVTVSEPVYPIPIDVLKEFLKLAAERLEKLWWDTP